MTIADDSASCGLISCMRNEAPFLLEWVAFHSLLGFERIFVVTNDCTDGTDLMLERLQELGHVTHLRNPMHEGLGPQASALREIWIFDAIRDLDWLLHIDADEFLNISAGQHRIADLLQRAGHADAMALAWRPFGDNGHRQWQGQGILNSFTATAARPRAFNVQHKTLFRPAKFSSAIDHMPKGPVSDDVVLVNSAGQVCDARALLHRRHARYRMPQPLLTWDTSCINHYAIRSHDIFLMKNMRGDGMGRIGQKYFLNSKFYRRQNKNAVQDRSILRHAEALEQRMSHFLSDPVLSFLHVQARQAFFRLRERLLTPERIASWTLAAAG